MLSWLFVKSKFWFAIRIADKNTRNFVMHCGIEKLLTIALSAASNLWSAMTTTR